MLEISFDLDIFEIMKTKMEYKIGYTAMTRLKFKFEELPNKNKTKKTNNTTWKEENNLKYFLILTITTYKTKPQKTGEIINIIPKINCKNVFDLKSWSQGGKGEIWEYINIANCFNPFGSLSNLAPNPPWSSATTNEYLE